ncbi:hypothetical protein NLJ89_g3888 [Agrocybe chaxingu]|uniref:Uncharacterized protein n=1 Tax=Agrocybe chaxingu TaxID=84603 RepID=A0A9W8K9D7_9AGAR|nr:hypothetical protein NLJ89_g3888 [Agrocybe chaxingu]
MNSLPSHVGVSQDELDEAKSLILDLLGWGVAPEYLVETGLTPAVVFRVFTDLNLRLPDNLELTDDLKSLAYPGIPSAEVAEALN